MPHLYFCRETDCDGEAHVYGGRCDGCFEAEIEYLRELHNPTRCDHCHERINCSIDSNALYSSPRAFCGESCAEGWLKKHKCSGEFDFYSGCYVCDDNDDPRCPSHHLARTETMTREEILNEIQYRESMLAWDRGEIDHAAVRFGIGRLRMQLAQMSVVRAGEQTVYPPCADRRNSIVSPRGDGAGTGFCDECGKPSNNGRAACLCWADEEDLARMDRDAALHR